jgi:hypothetical protein
MNIDIRFRALLGRDDTLGFSGDLRVHEVGMLINFCIYPFQLDARRGGSADLSASAPQGATSHRAFCFCQYFSSHASYPL